MINSTNRIQPDGDYGAPAGRNVTTTVTDGPSEFEKLLRQQRLQQQSRRIQQSPGVQPPEVAFSRHAQQRLEKRGIHLAPEQSRRLEQAVQSAAGKGAQQSLIFMDGIAFIVNVEDRRVVTALNVQKGSADANVFTNIDSAVLA